MIVMNEDAATYNESFLITTAVMPNSSILSRLVKLHTSFISRLFWLFISNFLKPKWMLDLSKFVPICPEFLSRFKKKRFECPIFRVLHFSGIVLGQTILMLRLWIRRFQRRAGISGKRKGYCEMKRDLGYTVRDIHNLFWCSCAFCLSRNSILAPRPTPRMQHLYSIFTSITRNDCQSYINLIMIIITFYVAVCYF